ncbi:MAG: right-handed parallel beta-helix repeat-containing protein [Planctomycetaceae bacterium]|nr:right-handed parallel beta-helix repeat-containing protein [Planctomycetaceae bacterium]
MDIVNERFREGEQFENPGAVPLNVDRMVLNYDYDVRAYFIHEGAGYKNTVGVKLKDDHRLLFPDCSYDGNENVRLQRGDFVNLGLIKQGTKLDLLVIPNGAGGGLGGSYYRLYTTPSLSDDQRQHYVGFWIEDTPLLLFGAEDLLGGGDNDFEDVMVVLDFGLDYDPPKTYYVSTRGNDSNTGRTPNDPFRTITKAAQVVRPGDTVNVAAGTYTENPDFRISGNDLYSIRFIANGDVTVQSAQDNAWLMTMYYADYYVFDGFRFTGKNMGEGVRTYGVYNYHSDVTFRNCEFDSLYYGVHGVYSGTKLDRCRIHDNQAYALLNYYGGLDIKASEIKNNANGPYSYREHFFSMTDTKIEDNQGWAILYAFGPYGTHQPLGVNQPKVSNCTIRNNLNGLHLTFGKDKDRITFDRTTVQGLQGWEMYLSQCEYNIDERWRREWPIERGGSGLYTSSCKLQLHDVNFEDYANGWGFLDYYSDLEMQNVKCRRNYHGMQTYAPTKFAARNCNFDDNKYWGFLLYNHADGASSQLSNCTMNGNSYGAHFYRANESNLKLTDTIISNNSSHGLYLNDCDAEFSPRTMGTRWKLYNNGYHVTAYYGKTLFDNITLSDAKYWGALTYYSEVTVRNCNFTKNPSGGLQSYYDKSFDVINSKFDQNGSYGLAYHSNGTYYGYKKDAWGWYPCDGPGRIVNSSISNNTSYGLYAYGLKPDTLQISSTPIQGNGAAGLYANQSEIEFNPQTMRDTWQLKDNGSHIYAAYGVYSFKDLDLSNAKSYAVYSWYSDVKIDNCRFTNNGYTGFQSYYDKSFKVKKSTFANNAWSGLNYYSNGTYYGQKDGQWSWLPVDGPGELKDCVIENNTSYGMYAYAVKDNGLQLSNTPIRGHGAAGLYASQCELSFTPKTMGKNWLLSDNASHIYAYYGKYLFDGIDLSDARSYGVDTAYSEIEVNDCRFERNGYTGLRSYYNKSFNATNSKFSENTSWGLLYYSNGTYYGYKDGAWGWYDGADPGRIADCTIENNTSYGIYLYGVKNDGIQITNTPIRGHGTAAIYASNGELNFNAKTLANMGQLSDNGSHIYAAYGKYSFDGIELADAKSYGVASWYCDISIKNSKFLRNGYTGFQSYYNKSFKAENSQFAENGSWGALYYSNGTYYGYRDGAWGWYETEGPGEFSNCSIENNTNHGLYLNGVTDAGIRLANTPIRNNPGHGLYAVSCDLSFTPDTMGKKWQITGNGYGITSYYGKMLFDGVEVTDNTYWGTLSYYADTTVKNTKFSRNGSGGLHSYYDKSFVAENSSFNENGSWGLYYYGDGRYYGLKDGAWVWQDGAAPAKIANCDFSKNTSHGVGFNGIKDDRIEMTNSQATENGGIGIYFANSTVTLSPATSGKWVSRNNVHGFHASSSNITVEDFEITGNSQWGMYTYYSNVNLKNAKFSGNGHNMYWYATPWTHGFTHKLTVDNSVFESSTQHHGLLTYYGLVDIQNSVFRNNKGTGLYTAYNKTVSVRNCEMTGNGSWGVVYHVNYPQTADWSEKELFKDNVQTLANVKVDGNYQGVYVYNAGNANFGMKNTEITNNQQQSLYLNACNMLVDNQSTNNWTLSGNGYGPYVVGGSDVTFRNIVNTNSKYHGFVNSGSKTTLENCVSTGSQYGFYQYRPTAPSVLKNNRFEGQNTDWGWGLISYGGSVDATNNVFAGFYNGSYTYTYGDESQVPDHTFYNNTFADLRYWGLYVENNSTATAHNNIFAHRTSDTGGYGLAQNGTGQLTHSHNLVHGFAAPFYRTSDPADTTLQKSPRFANAAAGDYHLGKGSPAINAGMDTSLIVPYDMEGHARPSFKVVEIGAYEYTDSAGAFRVVDWKEKK